MADLTLRAARPTDKEHLLRFVLAVAHEAEGARPDAAAVSRGLDAALVDPRHRQYYVAETDTGLVGCCLVTTEWSDWTGRWYWWFQSVYVVPEHRGGAFAVWRRLYAWVCAEARRAGVEKVLLYVHEDNRRAQRAYAGVGMQRAPQLVYEARLAP